MSMGLDWSTSPSTYREAVGDGIIHHQYSSATVYDDDLKPHGVELTLTLGIGNVTIISFGSFH